MTALLVAALISSLSLTGEVTSEGGDYAVVAFEVPVGTAAIRFAHRGGNDGDILDFGLWDGEGTRGWGGGDRADAIVGLTEATPGYVPGPIAPGTWYVVIGKALIGPAPAPYEVTLSFEDVETSMPRPRAEHAAVVLDAAPGWYAGDLHVHSDESGDASASFDAIREVATRRGLDWVVLSDHNTVTQHPLAAAYQAGVDDLLFVRGCEITTYAGHGNGLGIARYVDHRIGLDGRTLEGVLDDVAAQDGLFVVNHPEIDLGEACIGCTWDHDTDWSKIAAIELHTGNFDYTPIYLRQVLARWDALLDEGYRITGVAGSDDHRAPSAAGPADSWIGTPTTVVRAAELSEAGILEAIAAGRAVVKLRGPDDPMVELTLTDERGAVVEIGDTATGTELELTARVTGGDGLSVVVVVDGAAGDPIAIPADGVVRQRIAVPDGGGRVRVHVVDGPLDVTITNHVFMARGEAARPEVDDTGGCHLAGDPRAPFALLLIAALALLRSRR